jgi:hypothetical protein
VSAKAGRAYVGGVEAGRNTLQKRGKESEVRAGRKLMKSSAGARRVGGLQKRKSVPNSQSPSPTSSWTEAGLSPIFAT